MNIAVIGGGAAGMLAALAAKRENAEANVFLLEKNEKLGKKIFITGKGRGNLTNACDLSDFFEQFLSNPRFLYSALYGFTNRDLMALMEEGGTRVKTERGGRVFPASDRAYSITDALKRLLKKAGVNIAYNTEVLEIEEKDGRVCGVKTKRQHYRAERVIVATGGLSYPSTGSTGDGYRFARACGMQVTECYPSLTYLEPEEQDYYALKGLKLKNIAVSVTDESGKRYYEDFGELDFLPEGLSGPVVLSASANITRYLNAAEPKNRRLLTLHIDLKPAMSAEARDERLRRELESFRNKELRNCLGNLLPAQLIPVFLKRLERRGVDINRKATEVSREMRQQILSLLGDFSFTLRGTGGFRSAIVTQGGVSVKELNPKTLESKKRKGLYFAGEVIDVDAYTGGFNMQSAFSTGWLAGKSAAKEDENAL